MKYVALLIGLLLVSNQGWAQRISFEKDSLRLVFAKARQQNKPVLIVLTPPPAPASLPRELREARSKSGLNAPAVAVRINKDFLSKELAFNAPESAPLVRKYNVARYPTYLYFHPDGSLLFRAAGNSPDEARYLRDLRAFEQAQADPQNLSYFQREFEKGNRSADFLRQYLTKRRQLEQLVEPALLDAYVKQLPVKAFDQGAEVLFVLENGPVMNSKAYQLTHSGNKLTDSLYRVLPPPQRVAINRLIIRNTLAEATRTKDQALAMQAANFARSSWTKDYRRGTQAYETDMLAFYRSINDTTTYLRQAVSFYDRQNAAVSADSAQKAVVALRAFRQEQDAVRQRLVAARRKPAAASTIGVVTTMQAVAVGSGPPGSFLQDLNNAAWAIYQTGTRNKEYLLRATLWSKRTIGLDPAAYNHDTLAHLLYRLQFYQEAEAMQRLAVDYARKEKVDPAFFERELEKIKKRTL